MFVWCVRWQEKENGSVEAKYEKCKRHNKQLNGDKAHINGIRMRMRKCFSEQHKLCVDDYISRHETRKKRLKKLTILFNYSTMLTLETAFEN